MSIKTTIDETGVRVERLGAFHNYEEAVDFLVETCASLGTEPGELYVSRWWMGARVPTINLVRMEPNGGGQWLVLRDSIPVAWAPIGLLAEAGIAS